jgi:hypothetical protein
MKQYDNLNIHLKTNFSYEKIIFFRAYFIGIYTY